MQGPQNNPSNFISSNNLDKMMSTYEFFSKLPKGQTIKLIKESGNTHFEYVPEKLCERIVQFAWTWSLSGSDNTITAVLEKYSSMGYDASKLFKTILTNGEKFNEFTQNAEDFEIIDNPIEKARTAFWHFAVSRQGLHTMADTLANRKLINDQDDKISKINNVEILQNALIKDVFIEAIKKLSTLGEFVRDKKDDKKYNFVFYNKIKIQPETQKSLDPIDLPKVLKAYGEFCSNFESFNSDMEKYSGELQKFSNNVILNERLQITHFNELKEITMRTYESIYSIETNSSEQKEGTETLEFCIATLHLFFCGNQYTEQQKFIASLATAATDQSNTRNSLVHLFKNFEPAFSKITDEEVDKLLKKEIQSEAELDQFYKDHPAEAKDAEGKTIKDAQGKIIYRPWSEAERKKLVQEVIYKPTTPEEIAAAKLREDYPISKDQLWQKRAGQFLMRIKMPLESITKEYEKCQNANPHTLQQLKELDRYFNMATCLANLSKEEEEKKEGKLK